MTDLMLDQFEGFSQKELKAILKKEKKTMLDPELSKTEESEIPDHAMSVEVMHLSWLKCPVQFLTKRLLRFGSISGAHLLVTRWRGGRL